MALKPLTYDDPPYRLQRDGNIKEFNRRKALGEKSDLISCDLRHLDLRALDADDIDFSGCTFAQPTCPAAISSKLAAQAPASMERASLAFFFRPG
jgi:uncharacterized protein YjbI with pentapeptide repeats